jgi:hypothetical protein
MLIVSKARSLNLLELSELEIGLYKGTFINHYNVHESIYTHIPTQHVHTTHLTKPTHLPT